MKHSQTEPLISLDGKIKIFNVSQVDTNLHKHDFFELVYVTSGRAVQNIDGTSTIIRKGDYFIIDYGSTHAYSNCDNFEITNCLFCPDFIDKTLVGCDSFSKLIANYLIRFNYAILNKIPVNCVFHDSEGSILKHIEILQNEFSAKEPGHIELIRCHIIEILVLTMRSIAKSDKFYNAHPATLKIIEHIENNFQNKISLSKLCRELNFSLPYISKRFKLDTSLTFNQFLQKTRIEQSCRLLADTDMLIAEIANSVGYEDIKFFGKVFHQIVGTSPLKFRKMARS